MVVAWFRGSRKTVVNRRTMAAQLTDAIESGEIVQLQELKDQLDMMRVEMLELETNALAATR